MNSKAKIEFGDFQTPLALATQVCVLLKQRALNPLCVLEPTCGLGSFLLAAAEAFPEARLFGWDVNAEYVETTRLALDRAGAGFRALVATQDFFKHDWDSELDGLEGELLVLGNLPWVTSATVSSLNGTNVPEKRNFQGLRGIEARTGKSNFDVSEWMLIELIKSLRGRSATIAILCKTAIARKALRFAWQNDGRIASASLYRIGAKKHFEAAVDACLFLIQTGSTGPLEAPVYHSMDAQAPTQILGLVGRNLVSNIRTYHLLRHLEGLSPYQWRSGVKHDCSSVMELSFDGQVLRNKLGEGVEIESEFLFPLLKCSDLATGRTQPARFVLVTQSRVGEDTSKISKTAPRTWHYLASHRQRFDARKSSIYDAGMPFALFGIGDYSFAPWKVAISGLHKSPRFNVVPPFEDKPVMLDDTCYFLPFLKQEEAEVVADILNSDPSLSFISALVFEHPKRPITVDLLQRLNFHAIAMEAGLLGDWSASRNERGVGLEKTPAPSRRIPHGRLMIVYRV